MSVLLTASSIVLLEVLCLGSIFPVISYYCAKLGGDPVWLGLMWALMSGPKVVMNPFWGWLSDRWGRRPVLAMATLGTLSGSVLWALAPSLGWLAVSRAFTGVFGAHAGLAQAVGADASPPEKRSASMGILGAAFGIGFTIGPLIGGLVATRYSYASVGWACAAFEALGLLIIVFLLPETRPHTATQVQSPAGDLRGHKRFFAHRQVVRLLLVTLVMTLGFAHLNTTYPLIAENWYQFGPRQTGYALAVIGLIGVVIQGGAIRVLVARYGEPATIILGLVILAGAFFVVATHPAMSLFWVATALIAVGSALAVPPLIGLVSRCVGPADQGGIMGLNQAVTGLGRASSVALGGLVYKKFGASIPYASGAVVLLIALGLLRAGRKSSALYSR